MHRLYVSTADFRAPFDSPNLSLSGREPSVRRTVSAEAPMMVSMKDANYNARRSMVFGAVGGLVGGLVIGILIGKVL